VVAFGVGITTAGCDGAGDGEVDGAGDAVEDAEADGAGDADADADADADGEGVATGVTGVAVPDGTQVSLIGVPAFSETDTDSTQKS